MAAAAELAIDDAPRTESASRRTRAIDIANCDFKGAGLPGYAVCARDLGMCAQTDSSLAVPDQARSRS
jgi:hypothetical protein